MTCRSGGAIPTSDQGQSLPTANEREGRDTHFVLVFLPIIYSRFLYIKFFSSHSRNSHSAKDFVLYLSLLYAR